MERIVEVGTGSQPVVEERIVYVQVEKIVEVPVFVEKVVEVVREV